MFQKMITESAGQHLNLVSWKYATSWIPYGLLILDNSCKKMLTAFYVILMIFWSWGEAGPLFLSNLSFSLALAAVCES